MHVLKILTKKIGPSAALFLFGVASLYLADLALVKYADEKTLAEWALLRSFMMLGGTFALFGFHALIVREPGALRKVAFIATPHLFFATGLLAFFAYKMLWIENFIVGVGIIIGFVICNYSFQWLRSTGRLSAAYCVNSLWRVLFLVGIIFGISRNEYQVPIYLLIGFSVSILLAIILLRFVPIKSPAVSINNEIKTFPDIFKLSGILFLGSFSLAVSAYGESIIVNYIGNTSDVAVYYQSLVFYLFPGIVFSQYIIATLEPAVRDNKDKVNKLIRKYLVIGFIGLLFSLVPIIWFGGWMLNNIITPPVSTPLSLSVILAATSAVRIIYAFPSAYVGMVAKKIDLLRTMVGYLLSALILFPLAYFLHAAGLSVILSVAIASLVNWVVRICLAAYVIFKYAYNLSVQR